MRVTKAAAAIFLVAIGFPKADTWDVPKLTEALKHTARNKEESDIPKDRVNSFKKLVEANGDIEVVDDGKAPDPEKMKEAKRKRSVRQNDKTAARTLKLLGRKKVKKSKTQSHTPKGKKRRDAFGCIEGSISARVNAAINGEWMNEEEIARKVGLPLQKTRGRLYFAAEHGVYERRRLIQYRVKPGALSKKPKAVTVRTPIKKTEATK